MSRSLAVTVAAALMAVVPVIWLLVAQIGLLGLLAVVPIGAIAAAAYRMHQSLLADKTREVTVASRIHLATVEALATAIDARDQIGAGHVRRTQIYAVGMGRLLGLGEKDIDALRTAGLLHDIGKLAIPDHILNKPGKLTSAEFEKAKIHPDVGALILEKVAFDSPVIPTIKYYHEAWDGSGYPTGRSKEDIPLTARILAVADAFDTLRVPRPYRPAVPREKARQIIQSEAGTKFDPAIVDLLLRNLASLEKEIEAHGLSYAESTADTTHDYVEQIKLANREVSNLYELAREFSSSVDLPKTLEMFAGKVGAFVPFDTCVLYLLDGAKRTATAAHVEGRNAAMLRDRTLKVGQGATGFALKDRRIVQNVEPDLDFQYSQTELTQLYTTMASVPLVADGELIGAVTIYSQSLDKYGEEHIRLLDTISRIAADAIGKSLKHDEATTHALTDPMTGLHNARSLGRQFEKEVARASRSGTSFQLLMMDLDGFKGVNDTYGHKAGDQMLREIGKVIREQLREYDFLARYGGDEFVALIPETDPADVSDLCDRIENAVCTFQLDVGDGNFASVGVSLGASGYPQAGETFDQMIIAADKVMYERKVARKRLAGEPLTRPEIIDAGIFFPQNPSSDGLIVELDESHVLVTSSVN